MGDGLQEVRQLRYIPRHPLAVIPDEDEPSDLTVGRLCRMIDERLPPLAGDTPDTDAVYVALRVTHGKIGADDITLLEERLKTRNAVLCKIQKIMPAVEMETDSGNVSLTTVDDILNLDPMTVLSKAFVLRHGAPLSEHQRELLNKITKEAKTFTDR